MEQQSFDEVLQVFLEENKTDDQMTEKQRRIVQAAVKLFASKGFHASSTAEIAKEAGVAEGTIFRHYKSKKDILIAVVAPIIIKFAKPYIFKDVYKIVENGAEKPITELLTELIKNRFELLEMNQKTFRILLQEAFFHEELREVLLQSIVRELKGFAKIAVEQRIATGELRDLPSEIVVRVLIASVASILLFKNTIDPEEYRLHSDEEHIRYTLDILLNGLLPR